jgi:thiol-disulfide isomerase/thioredoxin
MYAGYDRSSSGIRLSSATFAAFFLAGVCLFFSGCVAPEAGTSEMVFRDVAGMPHTLKTEHFDATVLVFMNIDCPIANALAPELSAIAEEYRSRKIQFLRVYADPWLSVEKIQQHGREYALEIPAVFDCNQRIADTLDARVTPEVFVFKRDGKLFYRGAADDRYAEVLAKRAEVREDFLRSALNNLLAGKTAEPATTRAVGCYIERAQNPDCKDGAGTI